MADIEWNIQRKGREWVGDEIRNRINTIPDNTRIESYEGKLFWNEKDRITLLGLLLENVGIDKAVQLGNLSLWKEALDAIEDIGRAEDKPNSLGDFLKSDVVEEFREKMIEAEEKNKRMIRNHEKNGTMGYWCVSGIRHNAIIKTDRADMAIELAKNIVQDWEMPSVEFLGEDFPDVYEY
ncbi:hypothetical protein [Desulfobacter latus]|uniref:Uncharacterized protein n=1 Tax=Desulfobacter latus TaxID=2292 RepID=A0A850SYN3_9BACT|nr:hypothetical protein [Desulfobacter latus]NWH06329.1 hypothetical protein [Desulfobacter latus]